MLHGCGWASPDGHIVGGCLHGLFAAASARAAILSTFDITPRISDDDTVVDAVLDEIAAEPPKP